MNFLFKIKYKYYTITDVKYHSLKGTVTVEPNVKSNGGNLVTGAIFTPTLNLDKYKQEFQSSGFQIASTYDFTSVVTNQRILVGLQL